MLRHMVVIGATELKLLVRNRTTAALAIGMPLAIGLFLALRRPDFVGTSATGVWPSVITLQILAVLGFTAYITTASSFAARRGDLYLKRLRCGEASDASILAGIALPIVALAVFQVSLVLVVTSLAGASAPRDGLLLVTAVLGGAVMCASAGMLTSVFTRSAENAQVTTAPFFFVFLAGGVVVNRAAGDASLFQLALPGGAVAELVHLAFDGGAQHAAGAVFRALLLLLAWAVLPVIVTRHYFRWSPRP